MKGLFNELTEKQNLPKGKGRTTGRERLWKKVLGCIQYAQKANNHNKPRLEEKTSNNKQNKI